MTCIHYKIEYIVTTNTKIYRFIEYNRLQRTSTDLTQEKTGMYFTGPIILYGEDPIRGKPI